MTFGPSNTLSDFLVENYEWATDAENFNYQIDQRYRQIASSVNCREIANYQPVTPDSSGGANAIEAVTGQQWFDLADPNNPRQTFRKVVRTGTVLTGLNIIAHDIAFPAVTAPLANWQLTRVLGALTDPTQPQPADPAVVFAPIPNSTTLLEVTRTNIRLTIPATYNNWEGIVVLEYLKN